MLWVRIYGEPVFDGDTCVTMRGTLQDITPQKMYQEALQKSRDQLQRLSHHLQSVKEEQSAYIAREIHDDLGQSLASLEMLLTLCEDELQEREINKDSIFRLTREMREQMRKAVGKIRGLASNLRPTILDMSNLFDALRWQARQFGKLTKITVKTSIPKETLSLGREKDLAVYRIFQEALTNIARHSKASLVTVQVKKRETSLAMKIKDNGLGFVPGKNKNAKGFGFLDMQERAIVCGGKLEVASDPGRGTTVSIQVPLQGKA